jgi:hypothetical protein
MKYQLKMFRDASGNPYYRVTDTNGQPIDPTRVEYDYNTDSYRIKDQDNSDILNYGKGYKGVR